MSSIAATAPAVFITVPKYVTISPSSHVLPKIKPAPPTVTLVAPAASPATSGYASSASEDGAPKGKKRRLDHLTWEEKIQRKKLKNRVAAQTSRDRKKARMEEMEYEINELTQKTEILENKCESLQAINESLLEKNRKLDMEVELLRQQLTELQQKQSENTTVASCAGWINKPDGLPVDTRAPAAKEQHSGSSVEDCNSLPTLQDMLVLDLINDEEFDASKLEELAESLLADITADLEAGDREGDAVAAEVAGGPERLPGPVVGTTAECVESGEHSQPHSGISLIEETQPSTLQNESQLNGNFTNAEKTQTIAQHPPNDAKTSFETENSTPDTVYGTYDARTNSITIVMDDGSIPVNEAVEEIYCEGVAPHSGEDVIKCPTPVASPSQVYLNVDCSDDEDDLDFDPIAKFLCPKRPLVSPLAKSPAPSLHSATSDHGYESIIGSPTPAPSMTMVEDSFDVIDDYSWNNNSFNDLFPTLI